MVLAGPHLDQAFVIGLEAKSVWEGLGQARADQQHSAPHSQRVPDSPQ